MRFWSAAFFSFFLVFAAPSWAQSPPSAFDFVKPSKNVGVEISPDGRYIAFKQVATDKYCFDRFGQMKDIEKSKCKDSHKEYRNTYILVIYDLEQEEHVKIMQVPDNLYLGWLQFVGNDRLLASIGSRTTIGRRSRGYALGTARIISIDYSAESDSDSEFVTLFQDQKSIQNQNRNLSRVTNILPDDPDHILMPAVKGGELDLWKVNVTNGEAVRVGLGKKGTFHWYTDRKGNPILRFDCRGSRCRKVNVYAPDKITGEWEIIRSIKYTDNDEDSDGGFDFWPLASTENENQFYVLSQEDEYPRHAIKIYDVEQKAYVKTVFEHPEVDVGGALFDIDTGDYAGAWFYEDRLQYAINDAVQQKHYDAINKFFDDKANIRIIGFDDAGSKAVVYVTNYSSAGSYFIYDYKKRFLEKLFDREPDIAGKTESDARIIKIPTRDGEVITAYHYYPENQMNTSAPLLVMPHGGPEARDYFDFDYHLQYFVSRGYQVVQMNFRGSDGFGRDFASAGYGEWGGIMQDDVIDTVKFLQDGVIATPDTTCIVGYSYGGYVALQAGAQTPELFSCIVSGAGLSDLMLSMKNEKKQHGKDSEVYEYFLKSKGNPDVDEERMRSVSPVYFADHFEDPVLLVHGDEDTNVEYEQSKVMEKALKKAGKPVEFVTLEGEYHGGWSLDNEVLYLETIEAFLNRHLR